jgi:TMEM175 potassium channel family protein
MRPDRMIAFTDGVVAILITILVLELKPPAGRQLGDILHEKGRLLAYLLSFVFVAIYWANHHHLTQVVHRIDGRALWANIHLLFWLSLTPIATAWLGEAGVHQGPVAVYALVLLGCALAYTLLTLSLIALTTRIRSSCRRSAATARARCRSAPTSWPSPSRSWLRGSRWRSS